MMVAPTCPGDVLRRSVRGEGFDIVKQSDAVSRLWAIRGRRRCESEIRYPRRTGVILV